MRPLVVEWFLWHGLPLWLVPNYAMMAGLSAILGALLVMRLVKRDGDDVALQSRALLLAYLAALAGGFVFEGMRAVPEAIAARSLAPVLFAGRAAYGGLIGGLLAATLYLRWKRLSVAAFFDRAVVPMGIAFALVRVGCFLEGCDFGRPTTLPWGVRFPPGSLAAHAHASLGWVPDGSASLPVHPTELYESLLGLAALALALPALLRRRERDGRAFAVWMTTYAVGRFFLELLRADADRGLYAGLSTAQWVSLAILAGLGAAALLRKRRVARVAIAAAASGVALFSAPRVDAKPNPPPAATPDAATDVLTLTDGTKLTGKLTDIAPGDHATMQASNGRTTTVPWAQVARIEVAGVVMSYDVPAAQPTAAPSPAPAAATGTAPAPTATPAPPTTTPSAEAPAAPAPPPDRVTAFPPRDYRVAFRATVAPSITLARPDVPSGWTTEIDAMYRFRLGGNLRLQVGLEGRLLENAEAAEWSVGVPGELVIELSRRFEVTADVVLMHTWFVWGPNAGSFFPVSNAYGLRLAGGVQYALAPHVLVGASPVAFTTHSSRTVGVITALEPRAWLGIEF
jgi:phosphatidylglycerol:prolipoprotein diacylglycerol transferase